MGAPTKTKLRSHHSILMLAYALVLVTIVTHVLGIALFPKSVNWDSGRGILAAKQYEVGISPDIVTLVNADREDLSLDVPAPEAWRSPGYQAIPLIFRSLGLSWGSSLKWTIFLVATMGMLAWFACYRLILPGHLLPWICLALLCTPWMVDTTKTYGGGDLLLIGFIPMLLLINAFAFYFPNGFRSRAIATIGGFLSPAVFIIKYSGIFVGIGIGLAWCMLALRNRSTRTSFFWWILGASASGTTILILGYPWGPTPASSVGSELRWLQGLLALGSWPFAMTDTSSAIERLLQIFGVSAFESKTIWVPSFGLIAVCLLGVLAWLNRARIVPAVFDDLWKSTKHRDWLVTLMLSAFTVDTICYAGIVFLGGSVVVTERIARISGLLMLPFVALLLTKKALPNRRGMRICTVVSLAVVISLGPVMGVSRTYRFGFVPLFDPSTWTDFSPMIRFPHIGNDIGEQEAFYTELRSQLSSEDQVLLVPWPEVLYPIPRQRFLLVYVIDKNHTNEQLAAKRFLGRPGSGVAVLLPSVVPEDDVRAEALLSAFVDIEDWKFMDFKIDPDWRLWSSVATP